MKSSGRSVEFEEASFDNFMELAFSLEDMFRKKVELMTNGNFSPYIQSYVENRE
jgi:predicted nucleotidyltransferase